MSIKSLLFSKKKKPLKRRKYNGKDSNSRKAFKMVGDLDEEKLTTEVVGAHYVICSSASPKYLSGFYFNNSSNEYYVYQKMELTNTDAFPSNPSIKIGVDSSLYGYYQEILNQ